MYFQEKVQNLSFQGIAAGLIHGKTVHSFFGLKGNANMTTEAYDNLRKILDTIKVLIIDEKSFGGK